MGQEVSIQDPQPKGLWALLALSVLAGMVFAMSGWSLLRGFDAQIHDRFTRSMEQPVIPQEILIVDIDESSLAQLGPWPWSRTVLADLMSRLRARGARLQIWDLHLPEPGVGDEALNAVLSAPARSGQPPDVVMGQVLVLDPQVQVPPRLGSLRASPAAPQLCTDVPSGITGHLGVAESLTESLTGHLTATPDPDGGLRRLPAVACAGLDRYAQLTLVAAEALEPESAWEVVPGNALWGPDRWLVRGRLKFAVDGQGFMPIPFRNVHQAWPALPAIKVFEGDASTRDLSGKIVLVGATALGLSDSVSTPFHANAPGVSIHAELIAAALDHRRWVLAPRASGFAALLVFFLGVLCLWPAFLVWRRPVVWLPVGMSLALLPVGLAWVTRLSSHQMPVSAPVVGLLLAVLALAALQVERERRNARALATHLKSFLPRELADEVARQRPSGDSLGHPGLGMVMAVRVVGLERWCSSVDSLQALALIHGISTVSERHATRNGGSLQQLQGETLLFTWGGVPEKDGRQGQIGGEQLRSSVEGALSTARSLMVELTDLTGRHETERQPLGVRIALEYGPYLQAVAGSPQTRRPLLLGRAVDAVMSLLSFCEELASPVLLGEQAAQSQPRVSMRPMGSFLLTDSATAQVVYRVEP